MFSGRSLTATTKGRMVRSGEGGSWRMLGRYADTHKASRVQVEGGAEGSVVELPAVSAVG